MVLAIIAPDRFALTNVVDVRFASSRFTELKLVSFRSNVDRSAPDKSITHEFQLSGSSLTMGLCDRMRATIAFRTSRSC